MEKAWIIRAYEAGDEESIFELMKAVYPEKKYDKEKWMRWWQWMYKNNPAGESRIWVASDGDKIVGHYPLVPVNMKIGNEVIVALQNIDLMTHPRYRHQGMFSELEKKAMMEANNEGIKIIYGFPNEAAYPGHIKSGWFDICPMQVTLKPLNLKGILEKRINNKILLLFSTWAGNLFLSLFYRTTKKPEVKGLTISRITSFDNRSADFWEKFANSYEILTKRDKRYLNWRYFDVPDVDYTIFIAEKNEEIYGYIVLRCVQLQGIILGCIFDVISLPDQEDVIHCLISKAIEYFERETVDVIYCKMVAGKSFLKIFKKNGFIPSRFMKAGQFCAYTNHPIISKEYLKKEENLFIQLGDSDFI